MPSPPIFCLGVVTEKIPAIPAGDPQRAAAVAPNAACALARHRRLQDSDPASLEIDLTEVVAGKRGEEHLAIGRICNPVRAGTAGRIEDRHRARLGIEPPVDAVLPREPDHALAIENRRVQICAAPLLGKREEFRPVCRGVDSDDCVLSAFCDPSGAVRPNDDTVGRRTWPKRDQIRFAAPRI